ncbi:PH domain-containing protein [Novilysobacter erysipheiresistens]|uniref:PH domain-containing protein n=1 Tax=Novilysobacter erysipheiresistens TaxID=1749332 RepID=A0ABU7YXE9_9GAMM
MNQIAVAEPTGPTDLQWQPLPARARSLFLLGTLPLAGAIGLAAGGILATAFDQPRPMILAWAALGALFASGFGLWYGLNQYRRTSWRLDDEGLAVRRGKLWQRETRVPASRVQHLDLKRGPLQRRRELATLVVHTAGTRHSAVTVPHLDAADAERLRDRLGRQIDRDDD